MTKHTTLRRSLCLVASLAGLAAPALAQSCGGSVCPPPAGGAASGGSWLGSGEAIARLTEEYEVRDRSYKGRHGVVNDFDETLFVSRTALDLRCGVTDAWTVDVTLTYPHYTYRLKPPGGERRRFRFRGPGDTFVSLGRSFGLGGTEEPEDTLLGDEHTAMPPGEPGPTLSVWGGVSLPTGSTERPDPRIVTRDVSVSNLQTGTGTVDPVLRARLEMPLDPLRLFAEAAARFPVYENRHRYRTGDAETFALGAEIPVLPRVTAVLSVMGQRVARDRFDGEDVGVGGARWVYLVPGVAWQVTDTAAVDVSVRLPVYRRTETKLSDSSAVFQVGLSYRF